MFFACSSVDTAYSDFHRSLNTLGPLTGHQAQIGSFIQSVFLRGPLLYYRAPLMSRYVLSASQLKLTRP